VNIITGKPINGTKPLPDWLEEGTEPSLRDGDDEAETAKAPSNFPSTPARMIDNLALSPPPLHANTSQGLPLDLNKFYDEDEEVDETDEENNSASDQETSSNTESI
jgi:AP-3 complex subunit beta